ncbi:hypothetical protein MMC14_005167 [Varicellaria rhodocarpa]|nr:hypothetical protein [Varicellaria rhodocarpa]
MANLSQEDRTIILEHPLDDSLDHLRDVLRKAERSYKPSAISYDGVVNKSGQELQKPTSRLLSALMGSDVALYLHSKTGNQDVASELLMLRKRVQKGDFNYEHYHALSRFVVKKASDIEIWNAVFNIIITLSRISPPPSIPPSSDGTPITHSSASQQGEEQTRWLLEGRIFEEILSCTYRDVGGFFSKYFEGKEWNERSKKVYNAVKGRHVDGRWTDFPEVPTEKAVYEWLCCFQDEFLSDARGIYYTSKSSSELTGAEARRQLDVFVKPSGVGRSDAKHNWKDVQVIGELRASNSDWKTKLLQLGRYMRDIFYTQPTRRFVHGFTILGTTMELWVFDRSGPYSSGPFDIHEEPEQFIRAIAGYAMMSDEELGLDTFIERNGGDLFITITEDATGKEKRFQLERDPLVVQRAIVCRGTTCYRTKDLEDVAKFSWTSAKRSSEADLLRLAHQKCVKGVARLLGYQLITSIEEMRSGLTFPAPHHFRITSPDTSASFSQSQSQQPLSRSFGPFQRLSIVQTSSKKQKSPDKEAKASKRSRSNSQRSRLHQEHNATEVLKIAQTGGRKSVDYEGKFFKEPASTCQRSKLRKGYEVSQAPGNAGTRKRKSDESEEQSSKRSRSNCQRSDLSQEHKSSQALENTQPLSFCGPSDRSFDNRMFGCLVISPAGRATKDFYSILELLTALRDAIKAHRSLYLEGNILHRDISENNIIITNPKQANGFTGMLIDADLAKIIGGGRTGARHQTGTMEFMAIGVLQKVDHSYRHDLESFFYVLLWICARRAWEREFRCRLVDRPKESRLKMWYTGSYDTIARSKRGDMHADGFEDILEEFPSSLNCVKSLCKGMRRILFPLTPDGKLDIGTPPDPVKLYDPIIQAFDDAIVDIASMKGNSG